MTKHLSTPNAYVDIFILERWKGWTIVGPQPIHSFFKRNFLMTQAEMQLIQECECLNFPGKLEALILILFQDKDS